MQYAAVIKTRVKRMEVKIIHRISRVVFGDTINSKPIQLSLTSNLAYNLYKSIIPADILLYSINGT